MNLSEQQMEALIHKVARETAQEAARQAAQEAERKTVKDLLEKLGVDTVDVHETQKDFAHLRTQRKASEQVTVWTRRILLGIFLVGIAGMLWVGFKAALGIKS
ncbi:hypothetical protein [Microbulbifer spongiae]|uniref:DUF1640 domain-containing protein n=1 Tax=Microbulbifer spongiae TaxID=2944933 RepID=A0ABY9E862_9GAMM|nr:hypothetical protein [Microbulbifer sp. MI-G]WKD48337.1 hypothetical protein M8T91_10360 [Microbulbifer sp. MI-G]